ncbi:hypothetical protein [Streptomyces europaeiscabiei]|uniref:hypothetical protein n=1 Tax=Streptomyces europaeiscabiei TaxID=146819 RepID=UPI0029AA749E|nr:hypothetical protein [Streptomyces europaeiscabiei]MDX2528040.1 hypothetical protein [Streptomyces europaeiscabiei]
MALPVGLSTVTVTGTYKHPDGTPYAGRIVFRAEPDILTSAAHGTLVLGDAEVVLNNEGAFSIALLATDDADVTPVGWTYTVFERWHDAIGRSYPISLPSAAPSVDIADVAPTAPAEGQYVVVTGPQGPAGQDGSNADAEAYTNTAVAAHSGDTTDVHGIPDTALLETIAGAIAKVAAHAVASDPHGDRAYADGKFATITVVDTLTGTVTTLSGTVTALNEFVDDALTRIVAVENGTAVLAALQVAGNALVSNGDLTVRDLDKGYRFRRGGGALDLEATGADLIVSNWSGTGFNGTQRSYDRYSADALNVQHAGKREFVASLYGAVVHVIDPDANRLGFHGKTPVTQQAITGSRADGTALANLLAALDNLGLIDDQTTA